MISRTQGRTFDDEEGKRDNFAALAQANVKEQRRGAAAGVEKGRRGKTQGEGRRTGRLEAILLRR